MSGHFLCGILHCGLQGQCSSLNHTLIMKDKTTVPAPRKYKTKSLPWDTAHHFSDMTVADLLRSNSARPFILSALDNAIRFAKELEGTDSRDEGMLLMQIWQGLEMIPRKQLHDTFHVVGKIITNHKLRIRRESSWDQ